MEMVSTLFTNEPDDILLDACNSERTITENHSDNRKAPYLKKTLVKGHLSL